MLRQRLSEAMKDAMKARDERTTSTVRLILSALKDKDIAARGTAKAEGLSDADIHGLMQSMIKQRRESVEMFRKSKVRISIKTGNGQALAALMKNSYKKC